MTLEERIIKLEQRTKKLTKKIRKVKKKKNAILSFCSAMKKDVKEYTSMPDLRPHVVEFGSLYDNIRYYATAPGALEDMMDNGCGVIMFEDGVRCSDYYDIQSGLFVKSKFAIVHSRLTYDELLDVFMLAPRHKVQSIYQSLSIEARDISHVYDLATHTLYVRNGRKTLISTYNGDKLDIKRSEYGDRRFVTLICQADYYNAVSECITKSGQFTMDVCDKITSLLDNLSDMFDDAFDTDSDEPINIKDSTDFKELVSTIHYHVNPIVAHAIENMGDDLNVDRLFAILAEIENTSNVVMSNTPILFDRSSHYFDEYYN